MKPIIICASGIIRDTRQTVFAMLYDFDKFNTWYNDPPNLEVEQLTQYQFQSVGCRQKIHLLNRKMSFEVEVQEAVVGQYFKGTMSGLVNGTFHWSAQDCNQGTQLKKEIIINEKNIFKHLFITIIIRLADINHCNNSFSRLNAILCKKIEPES